MNLYEKVLEFSTGNILRRNPQEVLERTTTTLPQRPRGYQGIDERNQCRHKVGSRARKDAHCSKKGGKAMDRNHKAR